MCNKSSYLDLQEVLLLQSSRRPAVSLWELKILSVILEEERKSDEINP